MGECSAHVVRGDRRSAQETAHPVASCDIGLELLLEGPRRAAGDLRRLRSLRPDLQTHVGVDVAHERLVELIAPDADRFPHDDVAQRKHRDLRRAAADVDDHASLRLRHGESRADRGRHRLFDQRDVPSARGERRFLDGVSFELRDSARYAEDDLRERQAATSNPANEVPQHLRRHVEVGDDAMPERADRTNRRRRAPDHPARILADRLHGIRGFVDSDDGRLEHDDPLAANEDERVRRAEVDRQLPTTG